jgi:hypothetical protein
VTARLRPAPVCPPERLAEGVLTGMTDDDRYSRHEIDSAAS